jgi:uncharacterized metal-binding protein YceD (DUF177 family)
MLWLDEPAMSSYETAIMALPDTPEFSRPVSLAEIGKGSAERQIEAEPGEMAALAKRFGLISVDRLSATLAFYRDGDIINAQGRFAARITQSCVASGAPVAAQIDEPFQIRFLPEVAFAPDTEIELEPGDCDTMFHNGRIIDLGEAVAQSMALALDPFPRSPDAADLLKSAGVKAEEDAGPFGALAALRDKMGER